MLFRLVSMKNRPNNRHESHTKVPGSQQNQPSTSLPSLELLPDAQLLCRFLGLSQQHDEATGLCARALEQTRGIRGLLNSTDGELSGLMLFSQREVNQITATPELFRRHQKQPLMRGSPLSSPAETLDYLRTSLRDRRREIFTCLFLDTRHRIIACEELFQGSIDGACVYPRVVAEKALRHGAAAVIIAHNHPSGIAEPSLSDQAITRRLREALSLFEIRLLDHFVIGDGEPVSMASRGLL